MIYKYLKYFILVNLRIHRNYIKKIIKFANRSINHYIQCQDHSDEKNIILKYSLFFARFLAFDQFGYNEEFMDINKIMIDSIQIIYKSMANKYLNDDITVMAIENHDFSKENLNDILNEVKKIFNLINDKYS